MPRSISPDERTAGYCSECGEPCRGTQVDFGIGPYEAWGRTYNDVDVRWVSECCEADVSTEAPEED